MSRTACALLLLAASGCSWISVTRPPPGPVEASPPIVCTSSNTAPIVDTVAAGVLGVAGTAAAAAGCAIFGNAKDATVFCVGGLAAIGAGVALGFSADYGYSATASCRDARAKQHQLACLSGVEASCREIQNVGAPCSAPKDCLGGATCQRNESGRGYCVGSAAGRP